MKKLIVVCLVLVLTLAFFAGCTDKPNENTTQAPATNAPATDAPKTDAPETKAPESRAPETKAPDTKPAETNAPDTKLSGDAKAIAESLIGSPVADLYAVIGQPQDSSDASSCDGPGDDGELYYEGFTVYTYREGDQETVKDVY